MKASGTAEKNSRLYCLKDESWEKLEPFFPHQHGERGFEPGISNRTVFEAVLYRARTGCPWRDLPTEYGHWHTIYMRWNRWAHAGIMEKALECIHAEQIETGEADMSLLFLDSSVVRAHQHAAGARKESGAQAIGRSRGGLSTKIHVVCADERHAVAVSLTPGQAGDAPEGEALLDEVIDQPGVEGCAADRAYDTDAIRAKLKAAGVKAVIPPKANRKIQFRYGKKKYKERNRVERLVNRLKQFRAIATRYDKLDSMFLGLVLAALTFIRL